MNDIEKLIKIVIECAKSIRRQLGPGFLENVYKNAMIIELRKRHLTYETEQPIHVLYDDIIVGNFKADIVVKRQLILELKATQSLCIANEVQLVNYLTATGVDSGLLINFGSDRLQIKRKFRIYKKNCGSYSGFLLILLLCL